MKRREFLALGAAVAMDGVLQGGAVIDESRTADRMFSKWRPGEFQAHFIYTGVCESLFWVFPDGTSALLDCGDIPAIMRHPYDVPVPNPKRMAGETIADYVLKVNPRGKDVDYLVVSHWHSDHTGTPNWQSCGTMVNCARGAYFRSGFGIAAEKLVFRKAIDRGDDEPIPYIDDGDRPGEHMRKLYDFLKKRDGLMREKACVGTDEQLVQRYEGQANFSVRVISANGRIAAPNGTIRDLYADYLRKHPEKTKLNENGMSLGLLVSYGPFRFYTGGDFFDNLDGHLIEDDLAEVCGAVDVAKINHHGHHSMSRKLVAALRPRVFTACVWDQLHVTSDTMERLCDRGLYPGPRTIYPTVFTAERQKEDAGASWLGDIAPAVKTTGAHLVLTVAPGGKSYTMTCLDPSDTRLRIKSVDEYETSEK